MKTLLSLTLVFAAADASSIILNDAIKKKLVKTSFEWKDGPAEESEADRYGKKMHLTVKNISNSSLNVEIPSGFVFEPDDKDHQDQMVTEQILYVLQPGEQKEQQLKTYCIQAHDGCPGENEKFTAKGMADKLLVQLAGFVNKNKMQSYSVQRAVWSVSDNKPIEDIYSNDTSEMRKLYYYTGTLKGNSKETLDKGYTDMLVHYKPDKAINSTIKCEVEFKTDTYYWVVIQDINNVTKKTLLVRTPVEAGKYTYTYNFSSVDLGSGRFTLRLYSWANPVVEVPFKLEI